MRRATPARLSLLLLGLATLLLLVPLGTSSVSNYLKALRAMLALAVRRKLIPANPFDVLLADERPARRERRRPHEWTPEELDALIAATQMLGAKRVSKYGYTTLLRVALRSGCGREKRSDSAEGLRQGRRLPDDRAPMVGLRRVHVAEDPGRYEGDRSPPLARRRTDRASPPQPFLRR